jgi:hypothetical protein
LPVSGCRPGVGYMPLSNLRLMCGLRR